MYIVIFIFSVPALDVCFIREVFGGWRSDGGPRPATLARCRAPPEQRGLESLLCCCRRRRRDCFGGLFGVGKKGVCFYKFCFFCVRGLSRVRDETAHPGQIRPKNQGSPGSISTSLGARAALTL